MKSGASVYFVMTGNERLSLFATYHIVFYFTGTLNIKYLSRNKISVSEVTVPSSYWI